MTHPRQQPLDRSEFERQLAAIQGPLRAYIRSLLGPDAEVDDVLQETNLFLFERADDFEPGTSFKAWAFRVAYFKTLACRRDRIRRDRVEFSEGTLHRIAERASERYGQEEDRHAALQACLAKLRPTDRAMLAVRYTRGASLTAFARKLRKSPDAVHKAISRIRLVLRRCIDRELHSS